ncbi:MAG: glycosyltransferase family 2 protein [Lachnospiraceae bacterium]|nr:glycosyltransferase family 2 protein [Lachnospiraceae bacterium]
MEDKKISVVVPVYNVAKYLDKAILHIQNQTYQNLEILLIDDGSTDGSSQMCDHYAAFDSRIRVIHKPNGGSSSARNVGIREATGDYIGFLDADDWAEDDMYETLYNVMEEHDCDIAEVMSRDFDEEGNLLKGPRLDTGNVTFISREEDFRLLMMHQGDSSFCTKLIRSDFCKQFSFSEHKLNEDFLLIVEMLLKTNGVYSIEKPYYNILIRKGSNQRSGYKAHLYEAVINNSDYAYEVMKEYFPSCLHEADRFRYVQRLIFLLHIPVSLMTKDNECYQKVISEIRDEKEIWQNNEFLTDKEKRNLSILSRTPVFSKRVHGVIMKFKKAAK